MKSERICRAIVVIGDCKVTFEGPAEFVTSQVEKYSSRDTSKQTFNLVNENQQLNSAATEPLTEAQLVALKRPKGHHEITTVLAFALTEQGCSEFTEEDVRRAYIRAGVRPPKVVGQALRDAKSKYDYIMTGSKRGTYRLTNHGDRTVRFDMPK